MKLGGLIIGLLLVSIIIIGFSGYYTGIGNEYGVNYNDSKIESLNQQEELITQVAEMNQTLSQLSTPDTSATSFATTFLTSGWQVLKTTFRSFSVLNTMAGDAMDNIPGASTYKTPILTILAVVFIFLIVGVLVGKDLI